MMKRHFFTLLLIAAALIGPDISDAQSSGTTVAPIVIGPGSLMDSHDSPNPVFTTSPTSIDQFLDHPQQWSALRAYSSRLLYADLAFKLATDADLSRWAARMRDLHLTFEMESGVIKPWSTSGAKSFQVDSAIWNRIIKAGGVIDAVAMDEPMPAAFLQVKPPLEEDRAVHEIAIFVSMVHQQYPNMKVGIINAYPTIPVPQTIDIINKIQADLHKMGGRGLDFYRMDPDWIAFVIRAKPGSWEGMSQIQKYCDSIGLPFSLIYWAANYPRDVGSHGGRKDPHFWYDGLITEGTGYSGTGIRPDQYVIESWVGGPSQALPDSSPLTFAGSALTLLRRFYGPPPTAH